MSSLPMSTAAHTAPRPKVKPMAVPVKTAAELLTVSEKTIRRMIKDGVIRPLRHGRLLRIPITQLQALVA